MTTQTEALKLVLEALEKIREADTAGATPKQITEVRKLYEPTITAIKEALAQPEQEPVAWTDKADEWSDEIAAHHPFKTKAYKQWDTAMAMVGARHSKGALVELVCWLLQKSTPPQRKPLTDEQINDGSAWEWGWYLDAFKAGVRFAEAAHGIKE